ncbi:MAG: hypothetical protein ABR601_00015 [Parasphingopyxis sp.]
MSDTLIIIIAILAVLAVGFLVFRSVSAGQKEALPPAQSIEEGNGVSASAAATEGVVGDPVGVEANPATPGDTTVRPKEDGSGAAASTGGDGDDLERIKGLGPKIAGQLNAMGIARYEQIAGWSDGDIEAVASSAGRPRLAERVRRDRWVEQAGLLARGETAAFEEKFGKLG